VDYLVKIQPVQMGLSGQFSTGVNIFIYAVSWLLFTFSSAIGLSVVEIPNPHDTNIKSESLGVGIALYAWIIGTIGITYFLGGWLAGELSGGTNETAVSLHAVVVWSCTIVIAVLLAAMGVNSLFSSVTNAVKTTATAGMNLPSAISSSSGEGALSQLPSSFQPLMASLKQGIKKASSEQKNSSTSQNDENGSRQENNLPQVSNDSSEESNKSKENNENWSSKNNDVSSSGDTQEARSNQENSASSQDDDNESPGENDSTQVSNDSSEESNNSRENKEDSSSKNNEVSSSENSSNAQQARSNKKENRYRPRNHPSEDRIDPQALSLIAVALIQGDVKQARELFASNTELDEKQIDELLNSVKQRAEKLGNEIEKKANEARQYASGILWLIFISYIVALIASIYGARWGARHFRSSAVQHTQ